MASTIHTPLLYTGCRLHPETILYYYRARYYHAGLGRFVSRDVLGYFDGPNMYQYSVGNPLQGVDPSGLRVLVLDVHAEAEEGESLERREWVCPVTRRFITRLERMPDAHFDAAKEHGSVKFMGTEFEGSRQEYIDKLRRELRSYEYHVRSGGYRYAMRILELLHAYNTAPWDIAVLKPHGDEDERGVPLGSLAFTGESVANRTVITEVQSIAAWPVGRVMLIGCFLDGRLRESGGFVPATGTFDYYEGRAPWGCDIHYETAPSYVRYRQQEEGSRTHVRVSDEEQFVDNRIPEGVPFTIEELPGGRERLTIEYDESFDHGDATVATDSSVPRRADAFAFCPPPERVAIEDAVAITHDVFGCRFHAT